MKTSNLALIGIVCGSAAVGSNLWNHNYWVAIWAGASVLWAFLSYSLARQLGR